MKSFLSFAALMGLALLFSTVHAQPSCPGVTLKAPRTTKTGRNAKLTARLTNTGTTTINEGGLSLTLPMGLEFVAASTFPKQRGAGSQPKVVGQSVSWEGMTLAPRKKLTFRVKARVSACAPATGTVVVQASLQGATCGSSSTTQLSIQRGKTTCAPTQAPTQSPTQAPNLFFVADYSANTVQRCVWGDNCVDSGGSGFDGPTYMTFVGNRLYIGNDDGRSVSTCNWDSATNTLSGCVNTGVTGKASGVAAYSLSNGITYLFVGVDNSVKRCTIAPGDGTLSGCTDTGVLVIDSRDLMINNNILYVASLGTNTVLGCPIDPTTGVLGTCTNTQVTPKGSDPFGLAINGGYLYITYLASNNVYKCLLANLSTSNPSPCELTGANTLNVPIDIAFSNDGYAYITNVGNNNNGKAVTRCVVNGTTGDLGPCEVSSTFNLAEPLGIVFPPQT